MKNNRSIKKRILSFLLSAVMVISTVPFGAFMLGAAAATGDGRVVDTHTLNQWKQYFGIQTNNPNNVLLSTEYAGGIWTDKSVFLPSDLPAELTGATYNGQSVSVADRGDNFLVSLSAIASNKQITGYSTIPTDTVFMLDFSSSMRTKDQNRSSAIDELVAATNSAIERLLSLNHNNRVAVVIYSGNTNGTQSDWRAFSSADGATRVILPLDSYTTTDGVYLESVTVNGNRNYGAKVNANVKNSRGATPTLTQVNTQKSTYIQDGIYEAMRVLIENDEVTVKSGVQMGTDRMPVMVLMSDGEPTLANPDYNGNDARTDLGVSSMYDYDGELRDESYTHRETIAFMTMLTAAFAKKTVDAHYNLPTLFYSLGFGSTATTTAEAVSVLNTSKISNNINSMWNTFLSGGSVNVYDYTENNQNKSYTVRNSTVASERLAEEDKYYVDKYFAANTVTALNSAFSDIVNEIIIQSKYYPTYVTGSHDHSGYLTFVDKIGDFMSVTDISGIVVGDHLFTGERLAYYLADIETSLGPVNDLTDMGRAFIDSIMQRLGIESVSEAYALLLDANSHRQLYYDSEGFDDHIGWFSDAQGKYVGFWHEDITAQDMAAAVARGATHVIRSYAFLGDTTVVGGVSDTDMMYMTVRVATEIKSDHTLGDSMLTWRIPASLIPTVTYNVTVEVDSLGNVIEVKDVALDAESAISPIRLLFEVELDEDITDYNVLEKTGGQTTFYTNKYSLDPKDTTKNTYSHFEPSTANERYYYTEDAAVLVKRAGATDSYEVYKSAIKPSYVADTYYRAYLVYEKLSDGSVRSHTHYEPISSQSYARIEAGEEQNTWVVPKGALHRYHDTEISEKGAENNKTATMAYSDHPFIEADGNNYYTYSTQGNNGKLTVTPATAIKLTKTIGDTSPISEETFTFTILGEVSNAVVVRLGADGTEAGREALLSGGKVKLAAGESVYIVGLSAGNYTITEDAHDTYKVSSVIIGGTPQLTTDAQVTLVASRIADVHFINVERGRGNLVITKELSHADGHTLPQSALSEKFAVNVDLGAELAGKSYNWRIGSRTGSVTLDGSGRASFELAHAESVIIYNIPEDTIVTVDETCAAPYSFVKINTRDHTGVTQDTDNRVTISAGGNSTAVIYNEYKPTQVSYTLGYEVTKNFIADSSFSGTADFEFELQYYDKSLSPARWITLDGMALSFTAGGTQSTGIENRTIPFYEVGDYAFQLVEKIPDDLQRVAGVSYDRSYHTFTVSVTDAGGSLTASIKDAYGAVITDGVMRATFENKYHSAPVYFDIKKKIDNKSNTPDISYAGFDFLVIEEKYDGSGFTATGTSERLVSDAVGEARFSKLFEYNSTESYPAYYRYTVQETGTAPLGWDYDDSVHYVIFKITDDGTGDITATMVDAVGGAEITDGAPITFTNIYDPSDAEITLNGMIEKKLIGRDFAAGDEFTFAVFPDGQSSFTDTTGALLLGKSTGETVSFGTSSIKIELVGTYKFDVVEIEGSIPSVSYSRRIYDLVVEVDDIGGMLAYRAYFEDSADGKVTFTNYYDPADVSHVVRGEKLLTGRHMLLSEFGFVMTEVANEQGDAIAGAVSCFAENHIAEPDPHIEGGWLAGFDFAPITFRETGVHYYKITERVGNAGDGIVYDTSSFIIKLEVTDDVAAGKLVCTETLVSSTSAVDHVLFHNNYIPLEAKVELVAIKELDGKELAGGDFSFSITEYRSDFETLLDGGLSYSVVNAEDGAVRFDPIGFTHEETRYFVIRETQGNAGGITYDSTEYRVTITARDNHEGEIVCEVDIDRVKAGEGTTLSVVPVDSILFENKYTITGKDTVTLSGEKKLNDATPDKSRFDFTFELYAADESYAISGDPLLVTTQDEAGHFSFILEYLPEHIRETPYYYVVREKNAGATIDGVSYDATEYHVEVKVEDNGAGGIKTTTRITCGSDEVLTLDFANTFRASLDLDIAIDKTVENLGGESITADGFKFKVEDGKMGGSETVTVDSEGKGKYTLSFDESDIGESYVIRVSEINDARANVTYSEKVYEINITLALSDTNTLVATVTVDGKSASADNITCAFVNKYDYTAPETTVPETTAPETTAPETTAPETTVPETTAPETTVPETTAPETTAPETTVPETTAPETTVPETTTPETTVPETTTPETEPTVPDTGDGAQLSMWVVILCVSAGAIIGAEVIRRTRREEE